MHKMTVKTLMFVIVHSVICNISLPILQKKTCQSNLAKGGITFCLYSSGSSSNLKLHVLAGSLTLKYPFPPGVRDPI